MGGSHSRSAAHRRSTRWSPVPPDLRGKVALVTGVGRVGQIGYAVATGVARAGAQLVIADRNATAVAERARELASQGFAVEAAGGDLTTPEAARRAVATARALARELSGDRIRVNAVAPGTMRTADNLAQMKDAKVRWVELDDLVAAVLYLASDEARAVSGEILPVAGGDV